MSLPLPPFSSLIYRFPLEKALKSAWRRTGYDVTHSTPAAVYFLSPAVVLPGNSPKVRNPGTLKYGGDDRGSRRDVTPRRRHLPGVIITEAVRDGV